MPNNTVDSIFKSTFPNIYDLLQYCLRKSFNTFIKELTTICENDCNLDSFVSTIRKPHDPNKLIDNYIYIILCDPIKYKLSGLGESISEDSHHMLVRASLGELLLLEKAAILLKRACESKLLCNNPVLNRLLFDGEFIQMSFELLWLGLLYNIKSIDNNTINYNQKTTPDFTFRTESGEKFNLEVTTKVKHKQTSSYSFVKRIFDKYSKKMKKMPRDENSVISLFDQETIDAYSIRKFDQNKRMASRQKTICKSREVGFIIVQLNSSLVKDFKRLPLIIYNIGTESSKYHDCIKESFEYFSKQYSDHFEIQPIE